MQTKVSLPSAQNAERIILGLCLKDVDDLNECLVALKTHDFSLDEHRRIFDVISRLSEADRPVGLDSVLFELEKDQKIPAISVNYVLELFGLGGKSYHVADFIKELKEASAKRRLLKIADRIYESVPASSMSAPDLVRVFDDELFNVLQENASSGPTHVGDILLSPPSLMKEIQERQERAKSGTYALPGIPSHFADLDAKIPGLAPGHLLIVGARPRVGKTTFLINLIQNLCFKSNSSCLVFSLEMTSKEIVQKCLCLRGEVSYQRMLRGEIGGSEFQRLKVAEQEWASKSLYIDDQSSLAIDQIKSRCYRFKRKAGIAAVFIDYIQLIKSGKRMENRALEVAEISRTLKSLAKEIQCPIVALAQLNRDLEKRTNADKKPQLSDLRESGGLEADADEVILMHRPELDDPKLKPGIIQLHIEKNRFGETGLVELAFQKDIGAMRNYSSRFEPNIPSNDNYKELFGTY